MGLSISKYGGLKCLPPPPPYDVGNFCWVIQVSVLGFEVSPPFYDVGPFDWGSNCLWPFVGIGLVDWGSKSLPPFVDVG